MTLSAGVASWSPGHLTATPAWLVEAADAALYEAKALGPNTFSLHPNAESSRRLSYRAKKRGVTPSQE